MENRAYAAFAAAFLIVCAAGSAYLFYWLQSGEPDARPYRIVSRIAVDGLEPRADVTYMGLPVGHVDDVRLNPDDPRQVLIDIRVRRDVPMVRSMHAELSNQGLTGVAHVRLVEDGQDGQDGDQRPLASTPGAPATLTLEPGRMRSLLKDAEDIAGRLRQLGGQLTELASPDNRRTLESMLSAIGDAADGFERIERRLGPTLDELPAIADQARETLEQSAALLDQARAAASSVDSAGEAGARLAESTRRDLVPEMDATLRRLQTTARRLDALAERLQRQPQSVLLGPRPAPPGPGEPGFEPPQTKERP